MLLLPSTIHTVRYEQQLVFDILELHGNQGWVSRYYNFMVLTDMLQNYSVLGKWPVILYQVLIHTLLQVRMTPETWF